MTDLVDLIRTQCVPQRNCLLTLTDPSGESAFLYFRDAELIEANYGTVWGREAFEKIITWNIAHHALTDLPLGIKRAIWEPVDTIIEEVLGAGAGTKVRQAFQDLPDTTGGSDLGPLEDTVKLDARRMAFSTPRDQPHFLALYTIEENKAKLLFGVEGRTLPPPDWLYGLFKRLDDLGATLGGGKVRGSCIFTDSFLIWSFDLTGLAVIVLSTPMDETHEFLASAHNALSVLK